MRRTLAACGTAIALAATGSRAGAQGSEQALARCNGQPVSDIVIFASAPTVAGARRVPLLGDLVRTTHVTTSPELTRRYLLLAQGEPCTELRRAESERVLRAQPFIADAVVLAYDDGAGGVRVEVHTIDEVSMLGGVRIGSKRPYLGLVRLGNSNLMGQGVLVAGEWRTGGLLRDGYAFSIADHQVAGRPWLLALDLRRAPVGGSWRGEFTRPFLTDLQRTAWRLHAGETADFVRLRHPTLESRVHAMYRSFADIGLLTRIGPPRRMGLVGTSISQERERAGDQRLVMGEWGTRADSTDPAPVGYDSYSMTRANLLGGVRLLDFVRVTGFDGLSATQDLPVGVQAGAVVGRSLPLADTEDDWFGSIDLYAARGSQQSATRIQLQGEARYGNEREAWDGVVASGILAHYLKQGTANTTLLTGEWAGVWRPRTPGQLTLGAARGGVRGFGSSREGGAQRAVARVEQRRVLGRFNGSAEFGAALFADAGRVWAGEAPLGRTTPWRASGGLSLLAALPVKSARLWRVDVAMPSTGGGIRRWEVRLSRTGPYTLGRDEIAPVDGMRSRAVPASVFLWP